MPARRSPFPRSRRSLLTGEGQGLTLGPDGALYGVNCGDSVEPFGYVFRLDLTGVRTPVHEFNGLDGSCPNAELVAGDGTLYGTTYLPSRDAAGQILNSGIIFAVHPEWPEGQRLDTLYRVAADGSEGANLLGLVLGPDGNTLYGTAVAGGAVGNGVLF